MKILRPSISFEFFPPKTAEGKIQLSATAKQLSLYKPKFFSVTYGAGGTTRTGTLDAVKMLQAEVQQPIAPHIACIASNASTVKELLDLYKLMGVKRIVALRGDLPQETSAQGQFCYASELVRFIREQMANDFYIEVAAYPEIHPQAKSPLDDVLNLKRKQDAGADSAITQYFFNPDAYFYFRDECVKNNITMPVIPGIMPITQFSRLAQFSANCGAEIPRYLAKRLESIQHDVLAIQEIGAEIVSGLCEKLLKGGAPGLHFYTLNKAKATTTLLNMLGYATAAAAAITLLPSAAAKKT